MCQHGGVVAVTDPYDGPLTALRNHVEDLGTLLGIWCNRKEPDAHARRCANDAVLRELHLAGDRHEEDSGDRGAQGGADKALHTADGGLLQAGLHGDQGGDRHPVGARQVPPEGNGDRARHGEGPDNSEPGPACRLTSARYWRTVPLWGRGWDRPQE